MHFAVSVVIMKDFPLRSLASIGWPLLLYRSTHFSGKVHDTLKVETASVD